MKKWILIIPFLLLTTTCKKPEYDEIAKIQKKITEITNKLKTVEEGSRLKAKDGIEDLKDKMDNLEKIIEKLDQIEAKLDQINKRLDKLEKK